MKKILILSLTLFFSSCQKNKNFEVEKASTNFRYESIHKEERKGLRFDDFISNTKRKKEIITTHNARFLTIKMDIRNNTGELLENAEYWIDIVATFNHSTRTISQGRLDLLNHRTWEIDKIKSIDTEFMLNTFDNYQDDFFKHKPESIKLNIYIKAKNSVGFKTDYELIYSGEISDWR